jgi:hypothetical protein
MRTLRFSLAFAIVAAIGTLGVLDARQDTDAKAGMASAQTGAGVSADAPRTVDLAAVPEFTAAAQGAPTAAPAPRAGVPEAVYRARKAQAAQATSVFSGESIGDAPAASNGGDAGRETPSATENHEGMNLSQCGFIPSDHALAVGSTYALQALNSCVLVINKNTGAIAAGFPKSMNAFFGIGGSSTFDPRALFDATRNRFVVMAEQYNSSTGFATMWIAISRTSNPTGLWWVYGVGVDTAVAGDFPDFPTLGLDKDILYLCATVFKNAGGLTDVCKFLPKAKMYAGQAIGTYFFGFNFNVGGVNLDAVQPANHTAFAKDYPRAGFLVASRNINFGGGQCSGGCNGLVVFAVSNALFVSGTPGIRISGTTVATANNYFFPPNALQPGCASPTSACAIDTGDTRISGQVTYTNGTLWGSLNTKRSGNNTSTVLWFQLRPYLNDGDPACTGAYLNKCALITGVDILNEDCYFCGGRGNSGSDWHAVPVSNSEGDVTMVASYSDLSNFAGVYYVSRRVTQAKNTMHDVGIYLKNGDAFYQLLDQFGRNRWGDYSAAQIDSTDAFWFAAQYARTGNSWGTRIGKNAFTARNQP